MQNNVDPDQRPNSVVFDLGLNCLLITLLGGGWGGGVVSWTYVHIQEK